MRVLVLGGTGAIGLHLVKLLSDKGIKTVVTSRQNRDSTDNVEYIKGNSHDIEFLNTLLVENWDAIIDFMHYSTIEFEKKIKSFLRATRQYVFLSSARVYDNTEQIINENSIRLLEGSQDKDFLKTDEYSLAKARQEDILSNSEYSNWTIIRPYITYSENRLQLGVLEKEEWLYRALHGRTIVFSEDINIKTTTLTYGLDVSRAIASVIGESKALGQTFHITTNEKECKTWNEILIIYLSVLEKHLGYKPAVIFQKLDKFLEFRQNTKYQILYDRLYNRRFDCSKISTFIDTKSFVKPDQGLKDCLEAFLKKPTFKDINWGTEALRDRQVGEKTPLIEIKGIKCKIKYILFRYFF